MCNVQCTYANVTLSSSIGTSTVMYRHNINITKSFENNSNVYVSHRSTTAGHIIIMTILKSVGDASFLTNGTAVS